jgi:hypothetical protein
VKRLSFVIPNYNYAAFVGRAIQSALDVQFTDVEVIVVDDGSTDESVTEIGKFADRITLIQQANAGPRIACNTGFAVATGDWVIFLDSDDVVYPGVAGAISQLERAGVSKIQFPMQRIDRDDRPAGGTFPSYRSLPTPEQIRHWMRTTASYPTPPGSGNAYSRAFLELLFPIGDQCGDATDSACLAAAPFLGDVLTFPSPMFGYRLHGANRSNLLSDVGRFTSQLQRSVQRHMFAQTIDPQGTGSFDALYRGRHLLQLRVSHRRLSGAESPIPAESAQRMIADSFWALVSPGPENVATRVVIATWCLCVLMGPRRVATRLIHARFAQHV